MLLAAAPTAAADDADVASFDALLDTFPVVDEIDTAAVRPAYEAPAPGVSRVADVLGRKARHLPPGDRPAAVGWVIGKGKGLRPGAAYLLELEYPDDVPRATFVANRGADHVRGFATGTTFGDARKQFVQPSVESLAYPQSGRWQVYRSLFFLHDRFQGIYAQRDPKPGGRPHTPADGFHVLIFQTRRLNDPRSEGAAVGKIRLRQVPDVTALYADVEPLPAGLPKRRVFYREEMADEPISSREPSARGVNDVLDWFVYKARLNRVLGINTFAKDLLEFGHNQGFDGGDPALDQQRPAAAERPLGAARPTRRGRGAGPAAVLRVQGRDQLEGPPTRRASAGNVGPRSCTTASRTRSTRASGGPRTTTPTSPTPTRSPTPSACSTARWAHTAARRASPARGSARATTTCRSASPTQRSRASRRRSPMIPTCGRPRATPCGRPTRATASCTTATSSGGWTAGPSSSAALREHAAKVTGDDARAVVVHAVDDRAGADAARLGPGANGTSPVQVTTDDPAWWAAYARRSPARVGSAGRWSRRPSTASTPETSTARAWSTASRSRPSHRGRSRTTPRPSPTPPAIATAPA